MSDFFDEVDEIRNSIEAINRNTDEVRKEHSAILSSPVPKEQVSFELEMLMNSIKKDANSVKSKLKVLKQTIQENQSVVSVVQAADTRIRKAQHASLSQDFVDVMSEYNTIQVSYREKCKERIQRQLELMRKSSTSEEVEDMLEKKKFAIFTAGIITETQQARQALASRHQNILNLENSIRVRM